MIFSTFTKRVVRVFFFAAFLFVFSITPNISKAQGFQLFTNDDLLLTTKPETPGPFESVEASLGSYALNLESYPIEWYLNGELILRGVGERFFPFEMKDVDTVMVLEARVSITSGQVLSAKEFFRPLSIDILWHAEDTYTPPFYRGRSLPPAESAIRVVAIPYDSSRSGEFIYNWTRDTEPVARQSGYKSNGITVKNSFFQKITPVTVEVTRRGESQTGTTSIDIPRFEPRIVFESISSDRGAIPVKNGQDINLSGGFTILRALPYYFTYKKLSDLDIQWQINTDKQRLDPTRPQNEISLSAPNGEAGKAGVKATIEHKENLLQEAETAVLVDF